MELLGRFVTFSEALWQPKKVITAHLESALGREPEENDTTQLYSKKKSQSTPAVWFELGNRPLCSDFPITHLPVHKPNPFVYEFER